MKALARIKQGLDGRRASALHKYRRAVASLAQGKSLKAADEARLAEAMTTLGITPDDLDGDVRSLQKHASLTRLGKADDADQLGKQAAEARRSAGDHRVAARKAEQTALALDAQLRAHAHRRHEVRELERRNARLFASDVDLALAQPPEPEDAERPPERPENVTPQELQLAQAVERLGFPPPVGARP